MKTTLAEMYAYENYKQRCTLMKTTQAEITLMKTTQAEMYAYENYTSRDVCL